MYPGVWYNDVILSNASLKRQVISSSFSVLHPIPTSGLRGLKRYQNNFPGGEQPAVIKLNGGTYHWTAPCSSGCDDCWCWPHRVCCSYRLYTWRRIAGRWCGNNSYRRLLRHRLDWTWKVRFRQSRGRTMWRLIWRVHFPPPRSHRSSRRTVEEALPRGR